MARGTGRRLVALAGCAALRCHPRLPSVVRVWVTGGPRAARPDPRQPTGLPSPRGQAGHVDGAPCRAPPEVRGDRPHRHRRAARTRPRHLEGPLEQELPRRLPARPEPAARPGSLPGHGDRCPGRREVALVPGAGPGSSLRSTPDARRLLRPEPARRPRGHPRSAAPPSLTPARPPRHRLPLAAHGARLRPDHRPHPASAERPEGRRVRWLVRRRRLPEVHPLDGVQRRLALHERPPARPPRTRGADRRGPLRAALAREDVGQQAQDPLPPGGDRLRQPGRHVPRRPRPLASTPGRRPRPRPSGPLRLPPPGARGRPGRTPDQPQPGRPGRRGVRAGCTVRRRPPPGPRTARAAAGAAPLREGRRPPPAASSGDRPPPRLLPGVELARRHAAGRRRARPRRAPPRRPGGPLPARLGALRPALPRLPLHRHPEPLRHGRPRRRLPGVGDEQDPRGWAARRHPPRPGPQPALPDPARSPARAARRLRCCRLGRRVRRQLPHLRADRLGRACTTHSPTATATSASRASSAPGCSAATPGACPRWSGSVTRSRTACSTRSPT